jgi:hypothetical protein
MRRFVLVVSLPLCALLALAPSSHIMEDGLVAYYSFNQCDARDDSGRGSNGAMYGDIQCWCGIEDDGLLFDGINDFIEFEGLVNRYFGTTDFTVSFYFKTEKQSAFAQSMLSKRELCDEYSHLDLLLDQSDRIVDTRLYENPAKYYDEISPELDSTRWMHFALTREGFEAKTYINGVPQKRGFRCSGIDISNEALLSFSNSPCLRGGRAERFKGVLDELRIYDYALPEEAVWELYSRYPVENAQQDCYASRFSPGEIRRVGD